MAKYDVTPELAATIKSVRVQNHIAAKSLAEHIGKSQSYMSKLEKGDIKTIEESELTTIFRFIYGNNSSQDFFDSSLGKILDTLVLRYSDKEIEEQLWFDNYDTVQRQIPVPEIIIDDISERMKSINLSAEQLCERINSNEGISPKVTNADKFPFNEWQAFVVNHKIEFSFIKLKLQSDDIKKLLSREKTSANYITLLSMVYYLSKIETFGSQKDIPEEEDILLMRNAKTYLSNHKFFSIAEKNRLHRQARSKEEKEALLSTFDKQNGEVIKEILVAFQIFSDLDIERTTNNLVAFLKNLKWDNSFMMKLISMTFFEMDNISFSVKKDMIVEIQDIIEKYKNLPDEKKRIETYD